MRVKFKLPERIKKLVWLASNNPNEVEANRAARLVCKMLIECNCQFELEVPDAPKDVTYNDVTRSTEPFYRREWPGFTPRREPREPVNPTKTAEPKSYDYTPEWTEEQPRNRPVSNFDDILKDIFKNRPVDEWYRNASPFSSNYPKDEPKKEKRRLTCKTCKQDVDTVFVGAPELFECGPCQWSAYLRTKPIGY